MRKRKMKKRNSNIIVLKDGDNESGNKLNSDVNDIM